MTRTLGMVMVEMMVRVARSHNRSVLARWMPVVGLRMDSGTTKSDVRMTPLLKSTDSPCGENCSPRMLRVPATSSGHSWMMLSSASVSTRRPGEVPTALPICVCAPRQRLLLSYPSRLTATQTDAHK